MKKLEEIAGLEKNKIASAAAMLANIISNDSSPHIKAMANRSYQIKTTTSSKGKLPEKLKHLVITTIKNKKGK